MPHFVRKTIPFCYGHRIQGHQGPCAHLHGHNARAEVECRGPLNELGMVVDFADIRRIVGDWIDAHWDHRMILQTGDPFVDVLRERGEPVFELGGPPTVENLAAHLFTVARDAGLPVVAVRIWETDSSQAGYVDDDA